MKFHEDHAVQLHWGTEARHHGVTLESGLYGYTTRLVHASQGRCWWAVDWNDGTNSVAAEDVLIDVERLEWAAALDGVPDEARCESQGPENYPRRCAMRAGHRTKRHRCGEISWTNAMAVSRD